MDSGITKGGRGVILPRVLYLEGMSTCTVMTDPEASGMSFEVNEAGGVD